MKTLVLIYIAVLAISFVTSANHNKHHGRKTARDEVSDPGPGSDVEWPTPGNISDFPVPDEYTGGAGDDGEGGQDPGDQVPPPRRHGKNHQRSHRN